MAALRAPHPLYLCWLLLPACYGGNLTDTADTAKDHELAGIAGPPDLASLRPVESVPRDLWGTANTPDALAFPSLTSGDRSLLFDAGDGEAPLSFFITEQIAENGLGPVYNQTRCLGCHEGAADNAEAGGALGELVTLPTPLARAGRVAQTAEEEVTLDHPPPTAAYALFGDYSFSDGTFDPLVGLGGPVRQIRAQAGCFIDPIPSEALDPNLAAAGVVRAIGERAAPSYVGRGLIEAIYAPDIAAREDPDDALSSSSTLVPSPSCPGDCISGRHNENRSSETIEGGDPVLRLSRFGLRAASPALIELVADGGRAQLGLTSPLVPRESDSPWNIGGCDKTPDPEQSVPALLALREMIRNLAPPEPHAALLAESPADAEAEAIHAGAALFGVDLEAFRTRLVPGTEPARFGDDDADHALAADRQLNCVGCHTPIMITGTSPAIVGAEQLSNRWAPIFSDLLIHDMGEVPAGADVEALAFFGGVSRNLADFALPHQGLARGAEWRTAPLMALGKVGPPFLHDARVFYNPRAPAHVHYGSRTADEAGLAQEDRRLEITTVEAAIRAAIELHDLPQPPDLDLDGLPDYDTCPALARDVDWCSRDSPFRGEARNVIEKWHGLHDEEQRQVIAFLQAL